MIFKHPAKQLEKDNTMKPSTFYAILFSLFICGCSNNSPKPSVTIHQSVTPDTMGETARAYLANPSFAWQVTESAHTRIHVPAGSAVTARLPDLIDSVEAACTTALAILGEVNRQGEPRLAVFLVDTRADMQRLIGWPYGGLAIPGELTAAFVAGPGYRPFFRHELTHAYAAVRWGPMRSGAWLTEGLATLATGPCQDHSVDAVAAGYRRAGTLPPLTALTTDLRAFPELPAYFAAASLVKFVRQQEGLGALRALWRGERQGTDSAHPLGERTADIEAAWHRHLDSIVPAELDTVRLQREGC
jgi:hypothetical protein